jgi:hypothetical protein
MNILIIPEDYRHDQYILKPMFERLFGSLGKPHARVVVCNRPRMQGVAEALKSERIAEVIDLYPMVDLFILCVDRDGAVGRRTRLRQIEEEFAPRKPLLAQCAWEELETWCLAGLPLPAEWLWQAIRNDVSVKENWFDVLANDRGFSDGPGKGRKQLGELAARNIVAIRQKCVEDFDHLATRIAVFLAS